MIGAKTWLGAQKAPFQKGVTSRGLFDLYQMMKLHMQDYKGCSHMSRDDEDYILGELEKLGEINSQENLYSIFSFD